MKNKTLTICVFDDESSRSSRYKALEDEINYNLSKDSSFFTETAIHFISLEGKCPNEVVIEEQDLIKSSNLIVVDHSLRDINESSPFTKGETIIPLIRNYFKWGPIICVTAIPIPCKESFNSDLYEEIFDIGELTYIANYLPSLVNGYYLLKDIKSRDHLEEIFDIPDIDKSEFILTLSDSIEQDLNKEFFTSDKSPNKLHSWFKNKCYNTPGFLYSNLWTSMLCGIKIDAFHKYQDNLDDCSYKGIWNNANEPRWWSKKIIKKLMSECSDPLEMTTQEAGNEILKVAPEDRSSCFFCSGEFPDTVALIDNYSDFETMHLHCTEISNNHYPKPFFEPLRIVRGGNA